MERPGPQPAFSFFSHRPLARRCSVQHKAQLACANTEPLCETMFSHFCLKRIAPTRIGVNLCQSRSRLLRWRGCTTREEVRLDVEAPKKSACPVACANGWRQPNLSVTGGSQTSTASSSPFWRACCGSGLQKVDGKKSRNDEPRLIWHSTSFKDGIGSSRETSGCSADERAQRLEWDYAHCACAL